MKKIFKALSDDTRREILKLLSKGNLTAGEIASNFDMSKPSISKHLDILKEAELISFEKNGQYVIYSINVTVLQTALGKFLDFFN